MKFSKSYDWILNIVWTVLLIVAILLAVDTYKKTEVFDWVTYVINIVLFVLVISFFTYSYSKFKKLKESIIDLEHLRNDSDSNEFKNSDIAKAIGKYNIDKENLKNEYYSTNVEDYINKELLDSISNKNFLNIIPSVMIGFGILGTFIGLSVALQNFKVVISEDIIHIIQPLIDGIKIAFHTSIYGMIFSLVFNWILKGIYGEAYLALDICLSRFDSSERKNEKNMFVAIKKFSENIVKGLSKNIVDRMNLIYNGEDGKGGISNQLSELNITMLNGLGSMGMKDETIDKLSQTLGNTLNDKLNKQLEKMNNTLDDLSKNMFAKQRDSLEQIVNNFVHEMNRALGGNFDELGGQINNLLESQKIQINRINDALLVRLETTAKNIDTINEHFENSSEKFEKYVMTLGDLQQQVSKNIIPMIEQVKELNESNNELQKKIVSLIESGEKYGKNISDASNEFTSKVSENVQSLKDNSQYLKELQEKLENHTANINALAEDLKESSIASLTLVSNQQIQTLSDVKTSIETLLESVDEKTRDYIDQAEATNKIITEKNEKFLNEFSEKTDNLWTLSAQSFENVQNKSIENFDIIQNGFQAIVKKFEEISENVPRRFEEVTEKVKRTTEELPDKLENNLVIALNETFDKCTNSLRDMNISFKMLNEKFGALNAKLVLVEKLINGVSKDIEGKKLSVDGIDKLNTTLVDGIGGLMQGQEYLNKNLVSVARLVQKISRDIVSNNPPPPNNSYRR